MSAAAATASLPTSTTDRSLAPAPRLFDAGGRTLEDSVVEAWDDLRAEGRADCPVCGGELRLLGGCGRCGSDLS